MGLFGRLLGSACTSKESYDSEKDIKFEISLKKKLRVDFADLSYYKCSFCNKYHLTSKRRK